MEVESLSELLSDTEFGKQLSDSAAPRSNEPSRHNSDDDGLDSSLDDFYDGAAASSFFDGVAGSAASTAAAAALASQRASRRFRTPLLGRLPLKQQVNLLLGIITIGLTLALGSAAYDSRASNMLAAQNEVVGDALMHSQRLAKAAGIAVQGSTLAYDQLQDSVKKLTAAAQLLTKGGDHAGQRDRAGGGWRCSRLRGTSRRSGATCHPACATSSTRKRCWCDSISWPTREESPRLT